MLGTAWLFARLFLQPKKNIRSQIRSDIVSYTYNWSEEYVNNMYRSLGIHHPHQLNLEIIAARLGKSIVCLPTEPMRIGDVIVLDSRTNGQQQWQDFGHELCHALWHSGNQLLMPMPLQVYQEHKSNNFAQYACIPSFMLDNINLPAYERDAVWMIMEKFGVERWFAEKRLEQYLRNMYSR